MQKDIVCRLDHKGYNVNDRKKPEHADLRVSDNFSLLGMDNVLIRGPRYKFRIREAHNGLKDHDAYHGQYFISGDVLKKGWEYLDLYVSDPKYYGEEVSTVPTDEVFVVTFDGNINCSIPHEGYSDGGDPLVSDLRVSDDFNMIGCAAQMVVKINAPIKVRIRKNCKGTTDHDAYDGTYFQNGDIITISEYEKLYISDPCEIVPLGEDRKPVTGNICFTFRLEYVPIG